MAVLYPNLCYNEVCYKGTVLYLVWDLNLPDGIIHQVRYNIYWAKEARDQNFPTFPPLRAILLLGFFT